MADRHGASLCGSENLQVGGADEKDITLAKCRYRATSAEYARFSKAMDLPQQRERVTIDGLGDVRKTPAKVLGKPTSPDNLTSEQNNDKIIIKEPTKDVSTDNNKKEVVPPTISVGEATEDNPFGFKLIERGKDYTYLDDLQAVNPDYFTGKTMYTINCQRCVPTYEMRRRGYYAIAKPCFGDKDLIYKDNKYLSLFKDAKLWQIKGEAKETISCIEKYMSSWGDGARAEILVYWEEAPNRCHVFVAEQMEGKTLFLDPQNGASNVEEYFSFAVPDKTVILRIDNVEITQDIEYCCWKDDKSKL